MCPSPSLFNTCIDWVFGKNADQSRFGAFVGNTKMANLVFINNIVLLIEFLEVLVMASWVLHEEVKPL